MLLVLPWFVPSILLITLFLLPKDMCHTMLTLWKTRHIGPNLKVLLFLLLPIPLALWAPGVVILATVGCVLGSLFHQVFTLDTCACASILGDVEEACSFLKHYWTFANETKFAYLEDFRDPSQMPDRPFDIRLHQIFVGLVQGLVCTAVQIAFVAAIGGVKLPFAMVRSLLQLLYYFTLGNSAEPCLSLGCCPCWVTLVVCSPVAIATLYVGSILSAGITGASCASLSYATGSLLNGFRLMCNKIHDFDVASSELMFHGFTGDRRDRSGAPKSCFPTFSIVNSPVDSTDVVAMHRDSDDPIVRMNVTTVRVRQSRRQQQREQQRREQFSRAPGGGSFRRNARRVAEPGPNHDRGRSQVSMTMTDIWDSFFETCRADLRDSIIDQIIPADDAEACEPYLIVGLPALVVYRCCKRSLAHEKSLPPANAGAASQMQMQKQEGAGAGVNASAIVTQPIEASSIGVDIESGGGGTVAGTGAGGDANDADALVLHGGQVLTEANRPHNVVADHIWTKMLQIKDTLELVGLDATEAALFEKALLKDDMSHESQLSLLPSRRQLIAELKSQIMGVAINMSRLPPFKSHFSGVLDG
jgi:hypothetical protein